MADQVTDAPDAEKDPMELRAGRRVDFARHSVMAAAYGACGLAVASALVQLLPWAQPLRDSFSATPGWLQFAIAYGYSWFFGTLIGFALGGSLVLWATLPFMHGVKARSDRMIAELEQIRKQLAVPIGTLRSPDGAIGTTFPVTAEVLDCCHALDTALFIKLVGMPMPPYGADPNDAALMFMHIMRAQIPSFTPAERDESRDWLDKNASILSAEDGEVAPPGVTIN